MIGWLLGGGVGRLALTGAVVAALGLGGWSAYLRASNAALRADLTAIRGELRTCGARLRNITEDVRDDGTVDAIPDDELTDVPDHWLLPVEPAGTGD